MKTLAIAAVLAGTFGLAAPALAGPGQCYDAYGRPVGPVYDTDNPNYGFINAVIRGGGSCTGVRSDYNPYPNYRRPQYDYGPRHYDDGGARNYGYGRRYRGYDDSGRPSKPQSFMPSNPVQRHSQPATKCGFTSQPCEEPTGR